MMRSEGSRPGGGALAFMVDVAGWNSSMIAVLRAERGRSYHCEFVGSFVMDRERVGRWGVCVVLVIGGVEM